MRTFMSDMWMFCSHAWPIMVCVACRLILVACHITNSTLARHEPEVTGEEGRYGYCAVTSSPYLSTHRDIHTGPLRQAPSGRPPFTIGWYSSPLACACTSWQSHKPKGLHCLAGPQSIRHCMHCMILACACTSWQESSAASGGTASISLTQE